VSTRLTIYAQVKNVAAEQSIEIAPLHDELILAESGLDSLCLAILVARLEDDLGVDPFTGSEQVNFPSTLGQFVELYERRTG
jgi:acyl carrier protein